MRERSNIHARTPESRAPRQHIVDEARQLVQIKGHVAPLARLKHEGQQARPVAEVRLPDLEQKGELALRQLHNDLVG